MQKTTKKQKVAAEATADESEDGAGGPAPKSSYVGVRWVRESKRWQARIKPAGATVQSLGLFSTEEEAAKAFDDAARRLRGDAAHGGRSVHNGPRFR